MERRDNRRFPKRLPLRFTRRGEAQASSGFTTNISGSGMFIGTAATFALGDRLRIEVLDRQRGFVVEGLVVRIERVPLALRQIRQPGIGVRFLSVSELFGELFPSASLAAADGASESSGEKGAGKPGASEVGSEPGVVRVRLGSLREVERVVEHDLAHGGLFINTESPLPEGSEVTVEIEVPVAGFQATRGRARVVHRFQAPAGAGDQPNLLSGMGVVFDDCAPVLEALRGLLRRYSD